MFQLGNFSPSNLLAGLIFGSIGFVAFIYGKKIRSFRPMIIGIVLMIYPYFISGTLFLYLIGIVLTASLYFWRG